MSTINDSKPDIFSISEANMRFDNQIKILDYNIEQSRLHPLSTHTRSIKIINNKIAYVRRYDLEDPLIFSIWIELNLAKNNKLLVCSHYRQWMLPSELNINQSGTKEAQYKRYCAFDNQVKKEYKNGRKIIILADSNINILESNKTSYLQNIETKKIFQDMTINNTFTIYNNLPTFF